MTTKKAQESDPGDNISVHLSFKKNLGNYETMGFDAGITVAQREGENPEDAWDRAWGIVERELDSVVEIATSLLAGK